MEISQQLVHPLGDPTLTDQGFDAEQCAHR